MNPLAIVTIAEETRRIFPDEEGTESWRPIAPISQARSPAESSPMRRGLKAPAAEWRDAA